MKRESIERLGIGDNSHLRHGAPRKFIPTDSHGNEHPDWVSCPEHGLVHNVRFGCALCGPFCCPHCGTFFPALPCPNCGADDEATTISEED
jgi:hypothetical protein